MMRTHQERWDALIDSLAELDMPRLHDLLARHHCITPAQVERALAQVERTHGEVAAVYAAWAYRYRRRHQKTVARLIQMLAQPPLIPLEVAS